MNKTLLKRLSEITIHIENHDVDGIRNSFENGINPNDLCDDKSLIDLLISMYTRTERFKNCVSVFVEFGLKYSDKVILAVLLDDAKALTEILGKNKDAIHKIVQLDCCYTPLINVSLLHICAEYNHVKCAQVLVNHGANVDFPAGLDSVGFGAQTPIFHTVNQNNNNSHEMMDFLLEQEANLHHSVRGIIWGQGYPWETLVPAVNPISYAQFGLLPQMHRNEKIIDQTVRKLMKYAYQITYDAHNLPNKYLNQ